MATMLDVSALSRNEKLRLLETLWADLTADDSQIPSPAWHHDALKETRALYEQGKVSFSDWTVAKARIRGAVA
jgi:hypothetical protein